MKLSVTLYFGLPPIADAILENSEIGRRLPRAETGRFAMVWELKYIKHLALKCR